MYRLVFDPLQQQDEQIVLRAQQEHYLYRVLRLKKGDRFVAMNGRGESWIAELAGSSAQILEPLRVASELPISVSLIVALPKSSGFEQIVRCCTELGVSTLVPVVSDRTLLKPSANKLERWRKLATEAAEQSERQIVPAIWEPTSFSKAIERIADAEVNKYIGVARNGATHLLQCLNLNQADQIVIATGPEGGWTTAEVEKAIAAGFEAVSLGHRILRAVTAPIVALSLAAAVAEKA